MSLGYHSKSIVAAYGGVRAQLPTHSRVDRPRRFRAIHAVIAALVGAALWHLGAAGYIHAKAWLAQYLIRSAWEQSLATGQVVKPWPWADTWPIARLRVARLGIDLYVLAGDSGRSLAFGPGHRFGTAQPGALGNAVVSAHRDTHFAFLRDIAAGDAIEIEATDGTRRSYVVESHAVAHKSALRLLAETPHAQLTLVTCWPFDAIEARGPLRFVVTAVAADAL
jgi:sortase A